MHVHTEFRHDNFYCHVIFLSVFSILFILFENKNYPSSTLLDELQFYHRIRFLGYFRFSLSISWRTRERRLGRSQNRLSRFYPLFTCL
ncbi:hypothetical protein BU200_02675 [Streptococcus acidominimus]|uniref:Uncharacterized protein n=1 Tax=Streptococcus acidominimus TaxID=1326 RepID=A0A1Q8EEQ9_STRAI|nr:hypothetical protein BU200_02675 [Streptococcus acidominimus]